MCRRFIGTFPAFFFFPLACLAVFAQSHYTITDLGGNSASVTLTVAGINQHGQVVGTANSSSGQSTAFRTAPNAPINLATDSLGTLGGNSSWAAGINASGQVVGASNAASGALHGFRTAANSPINPGTDDLGTLGGSSSSAAGVNDAGQAVGVSTAPSGQNHAFITAPNSAINPGFDDVGALSFSPYAAQSSGANSINSAGRAAGYFVPTASSCPGCNYLAAYVYQNGPITEIPQFIRAPFGEQLTPINDSDQVADTVNCTDPSDQLPCIAVWQNGVVTPLAQCDCETHGLNNSLQIVGQGYRIPGVPSSPSGRAFLYTNGKVYDLNALLPSGSGWVVTNAIAINDSGRIIGTGQLNGVNHVFRMDPVIACPPRPAGRRAGSDRGRAGFRRGPGQQCQEAGD